MHLRTLPPQRRPGQFVVLVTGGRAFTARHHLYEALDLIEVLCRKRRLQLTIVQGGATGADRIARTWASLNGYHCIEERADWRKLGPKAGPIRNQFMLDRHQPDLCLAMPGGAGTIDMMERCQLAGIPVWHGE